MQRFFFEQSPLLVIPCLLLAGFFSWYLYRSNNTWSKNINRLLTGLRFISIFILLVLLLGPVLKLVLNQTDKPVLVLLLDDSRSVALRDTVNAKQLLENIKKSKSDLQEEGYEVQIRGLDGKLDPAEFTAGTSDLSGALRKTETDLDGENLSAVVLISDGIFNNGVSPLYSLSAVPIHTLAIGDTLKQRDIRLKQLSYNKVVFQGNRFPLRTEVLSTGIENNSYATKISVYASGKLLESKSVVVGERNFHTIDFQLEANKPGLIRYDVVAEPIKGEANTANNRMSAVIEVVDSKKQILIVSSSPHPDVKAIVSTIEKNENYSIKIHIPGVQEIPDVLTEIGKTDVVVFNQLPDNRSSAQALIDKAAKEEIPSFFIIGQQTSLRQLPKSGVPVNFESFGQWDEVSGAPVQRFDLFQIPEQTAEILGRTPPLITPFGKFTFSGEIKPLLIQRIGNVFTDRPLFFAMEKDENRVAVLMAEGIWRWRMKEFQLTEKTIVFDELFSKMIQYLGTPEDKRKFRCYPTLRSFNENQPVVLDVQIFNEVFQFEYGLPVQVEIFSENGEKKDFSFTPNPSRSSLSLSLPGGIYRYRATLQRNGKTESDAGVFSVLPGDPESQELSADFSLLRQLAKNSGGQFFTANDWTKLNRWLTDHPAPSRVRSNESFYPAIDLIWIFILIVLIAGIEWGIRKAEGGY
jgi:hypothetical protein